MADNESYSDGAVKGAAGRGVKPDAGFGAGHGTDGNIPEVQGGDTPMSPKSPAGKNSTDVMGRNSRV